MRISDWSSDVCSSDLPLRLPASRPQRRFPSLYAPRFRTPALARLHSCQMAYRRGRGYDSSPAPRQHHDCTSCRSEEHTSELQSLMRISYAVFCLKKKKSNTLQTILHFYTVTT